MSANQQHGWQDGWTAQAPAQIGFAWAPNDGGDYVDRHGDGFLYRDLGLQDASDGALGVQRIRVGDPSAVGGWRDLGVDFDFLYVLAGSVTVRSDGADDLELGVGGGALHPRGYHYRLTDPSPDFDAVHVTAPASFHLSGDDGSGAGDETPVYTHDTADSYVTGQGPRAYFRYRDLGTRGPTEGRIHFHVVNATEPGEAGTGWHYHSMAQWFMVIGGSAVIRVEDRPRYPIAWGDAMCVGMGPKMRHNVTDFTGDYKVLELCLPADYETIAVDEPVGADDA
jgi:quercetin dioxygenase-like cupin family protein